MIWLLFFRRHRENFKVWLRSPAKWWERVLAAVSSFVVFAIIGLIARFFAAPLPLLPLETLLQTLLLWSGIPALVAAVLGVFFPKTMLCAVYPFSLISVDVDVNAS